MELDASLLSVHRRLRVEAFLLLGAAVVAWFLVAPHLGRVGNWPAIAIVGGGVLPATFGLAFIALPLRTWHWRTLVALALGAGAVAAITYELGPAVVANYAKFSAYVLVGWAFLLLFEELWWVVLVAAIIPIVDAASVARGPTKQIVTHHFDVYTALSVAFRAPGSGEAYLGPPDILFFGVFLAAAARWRLRPGWTWLAMTGLYAFTLVLTNLVDVPGLPALPFLSFGFLIANADLLWRRLRKPRSPQADA